MADLYIIGHIASAKNFKCSQVLCKWSFHAGNSWKIIKGIEEGQTQECFDSYMKESIWDHPIDIHYATHSLQSSPKILLQIFHRDNFGRILFNSYAICNIPLLTGYHSIECHTWKPIGDWKDRLRDKFLGMSLQLTSPSVLVNTIDRFELLTESMGTVKIKVTWLKDVEDIAACLNDTECNDLAFSEPYTENSIGAKNTEHLNVSTMTTFEATTNSIQTVETVTIGSQAEITTVSLPQPSSTMSNKQQSNRTIRKIQTDVCECDITVLSCDINCCCDADCMDYHLSVFSRCKDFHAELYDSRYCYNRNFIERNNTPFILEKLSNNLFCVLYDNLPPTYNNNNNLVIHNRIDLDATTKSNKLQWLFKYNPSLHDYTIRKFYQDGDILLKLKQNSIQPLDIPQIGFSELCSFKKTVQYLRDWKGSCIQTNLTNENEYLFPDIFSNFSVITSPELLNQTYLMLEKVCPRNVCLSLTSYYCHNDWVHCNKTAAPGFCTNRICQNIVRGVKYVVVHNGTFGIDNISVYFLIGNASHNFYQHFDIMYEWVGLEKDKVFSRSGNPGYTYGRPILIGRLNINKTNNFESRYISFNKSNCFFTLPISGKDGECSVTKKHVLIFGDDIKLKCSLRIKTNNFSTSSCIQLQNQTIQLLMNDTLLNVTQLHPYNLYVSKLGNITNNDTSNWVQILFDQIPQNVVTGQVVNGQLRCSGLITSMKIDILYSTLSKPKTLTNYNIIGFGVTLSDPVDILWPKCMIKNCTDILQTDITTYVTFHDISKPSKYYFVGAPNLDLTLPYDFFYPFLRNSGGRIGHKFMVTNLIYLIFYIIISYS